MSDITAFFKPTASPKKAAAAGSVTASPAKPTAASRKRKSAGPADESREENAEQTAAADGDAAAAAAAPAASSASATAAASSDDAAAAAGGPAKRPKLEVKPGSLASQVPADWAAALSGELTKPYFNQIDAFLRREANSGVKVFPARENIFRALQLCPLNKVRVVILGQDPYHDDGQAEGLCFSVPEGVRVPSSLQNIYKELASDLGAGNFTKPKHGHLFKWGEQGVLLLNTGLTVEAHKANSHKKLGWHNFTEAIIKVLNKERKGVVYLLWGNHAQQAAKSVDLSKHHVLKSVHPSGLSASRGFFGCKHFSKANELIKKEGGEPINWQV